MYRHIRDLREDADLSQQELAQVLYVSQATYSRYESGVMDIPSKTLIQLAQFYRTSVDYLLDRTDDRTPPRGEKGGPKP